MPLIANANRSFVGCAIQGLGFVLEPNEACLARERGEDEVVRLFLTSSDLNSCVGSVPTREIIFFGGMSLSKAQQFPYCLTIVENRVKPYRETVNRKAHRDLWWQYGDRRPGLYTAISGLHRVLVVGLTSKHLAFEFVPTNYVYDQTTVVVASDSAGDFGMVSSTLHQLWALRFGANRGGTPRYNPSRCFVPFPFPPILPALSETGQVYHEFRRQLMSARKEGLTKIYNRFHDPHETAEDIRRLRDLHAALDETVASAYGWSDLDLGYNFHETKQGLRYTISERTRNVVLDRLLLLNQERYAEEVSTGHRKRETNDRKSARVPRGSKPDFASGASEPVENDLFGQD
jgi:hypothetical protein